jgi:hypothetical protein
MRSEAREIKLMKANTGTGIESITGIDMIESKSFEKNAPFVPCSLRSPDHQSDGSESVQSPESGRVRTLGLISGTRSSSYCTDPLLKRPHLGDISKDDEGQAIW